MIVKQRTDPQDAIYPDTPHIYTVEAFIPQDYNGEEHYDGVVVQVIAEKFTSCTIMDTLYFDDPLRCIMVNNVCVQSGIFTQHQIEFFRTCDEQ